MSSPKKDVSVFADPHVLLHHVESLTRAGTWELNIKDRTLVWSDGIYRMLGYEPDELGLEFEHGVSIIHPDDRERATNYLLQSIENWSEYKIQKRLVRKDGSIVHVISKASLVLDETGAPWVMAGVFQDISELVELQRLLEQASDLARVGGWEVDMINDKHYWSPTTCDIHEVPHHFRPDFDKAFQFYHPDHRDDVKRHVEKAVGNNEPFDFEAVIVTANGNEVWVRSIGNSEFVDGQCVRIFGSIQDISARKHLEKRHIAMTNNVPGTLFQYRLAADGSDELLYVTSGAKELWGFTPEECMQDTARIWARIQQGGDFEEMKESILESARTMSRWHYTYLYNHPEHGLRYHEGWGNPISQKDGVTLWYSIIQDVTEKHNLESEIHEKNLQLQALNQIVGDLLESDDWAEVISQILMTAGELSNADRAYFFEFHTDSMTGNQLATQRYEWVKSGVLPHVNHQDLINIQTDDYPEFYHRLLSGETINWVVGAVPESPTRSALLEFGIKSILSIPIVVEGHSFGFIGFDDSEHGRCWSQSNVNFLGSIASNLATAIQRRLNKQSLEKTIAERDELLRKLEDSVAELADSNRELEQFAYVASHDLQEPLRMVSSFMQKLESKYNDQLDDKARQYIHYAADGATRMRHVIMDLLEFSRIGRDDEPIVDVDLNQLVDVIVQLNNELIVEKRAIVKRTDLPTVSVARTPMLQVLQNLIVNALKYSKAGVDSRIEVTSADVGYFWQISVHDNGIGIADEFHGKVFIIFQRLHARNEYGGTGIGLAIVKKIVETMGGKIWVDSVEGEGSTFHFTIPK